MVGILRQWKAIFGGGAGGDLKSLVNPLIQHAIIKDLVEGAWQQTDLIHRCDIPKPNTSWIWKDELSGPRMHGQFCPQEVLLLASATTASWQGESNEEVEIVQN